MKLSVPDLTVVVFRPSDLAVYRFESGEPGRILTGSNAVELQPLPGIPAV